MVKRVQKVSLICGRCYPDLVNVLRRWDIRPVRFFWILVDGIARVSACYNLLAESPVVKCLQVTEIPVRSLGTIFVRHLTGV
jgi:hypothetical protein